MPPAQRAQMEALMRVRGTGAAGAAAAAPKTQFRKTGTDRVGTWTCDKYEGTLNNQKVSEGTLEAEGYVGVPVEKTTSPAEAMGRGRARGAP